jgi:hypothetical protein
MSRVNSTVDLVASAKPVTELSAPSEYPIQSNEALARSLAAAENATDDNEPLAKRRRTRAGGDEPVFYGSHQSMSREQLFSTLVRLLHQTKPGSLSFVDLNQLPTNYENTILANFRLRRH